MTVFVSYELIRVDPKVISYASGKSASENRAVIAFISCTRFSCVIVRHLFAILVQFFSDHLSSFAIVSH